MSNRRTWFADYHSVGGYRAPKGQKPVSIYQSHRKLAWSMLVIIVLSVIAMIYISVTPDDDQPDEDTVTHVG